MLIKDVKCFSKLAYYVWEKRRNMETDLSSSHCDPDHDNGGKKNRNEEAFTQNIPHANPNRL